MKKPGRFYTIPANLNQNLNMKPTGYKYKYKSLPFPQLACVFINNIDFFFQPAVFIPERTLFVNGSVRRYYFSNAT